ncbi:MAG: XrtA/PEP-CTERM system TPR-repeat protein PrsT [Pseudomonadota bacterium]
MSRISTPTGERTAATSVAIKCLSAFLLLQCAACGLGLDSADRLARGQQAFADGDTRTASLDAKSVLAEDPNNLAASLLLARAAAAEGDNETAAFEFERAVDLGAELSAVAVAWGESLLKLNRSDELLARILVDESFDQATVLQVLLLRGSAHQIQGDSVMARAEYAKALSLEPNSEVANVGVVTSYFEEGDISVARHRVDALLEQHPEWPMARLASAEIYRAEQRPRDAVGEFSAVVAAAEDALAVGLRVRAHAGLTATWLDLRDLDKATKSLDALRELAPEAFATRFFETQLQLERGNVAAAVSSVDELVRNAPRDIAVLLLAGRVNLARGTLGQADTHLTRAFADAPENPVVRRLLAELRLRQGRVEDADALIAPLLDEGNADPSLLQLVLRIKTAAGQGDAGVVRYEAALAKDPDNADLRFGLALSQVLSGRLDAADVTLATLPADDDEFGWRKDLLGVFAMLRRRDASTAATEIERLVDEWPETVEVHRAAAMIAEANGQRDRAREGYQRVVVLAPASAQGYLDLARIAAVDGDAAQARKDIEQGLAAIPESVALLLAMAQVAASDSDDPSEALGWLNKARAAEPTALRPLLALAEFHRASGSIGQALTFAREAVQLEPANPAALELLGLTQLRMGDAAAAVATLTDAVEQGGETPTRLHNLARAQLASADAPAAMRTLARIEGRDYTTDLLRAAAMADVGNADGAMDIAKRLRAERPDEADPLELIGQIELGQGDPQRAADSLSRAYELDPTSDLLEKATFARFLAGREDADELMLARLDREPGAFALRRNYAHMLAAAGRSADAIVQYERVLSESPDDVASLNNLAWLLAEQDDPRGVALARRAVDLAPDSVQTNDTLGWILVGRGELIEGTSRLRHALQQGAQDPEIRYHLAVALDRSGDTRGATAQLNRALATEGPFASRAQAEELLRAIRGRKP